MTSSQSNNEDQKDNAKSSDKSDKKTKTTKTTNSTSTGNNSNSKTLDLKLSPTKFQLATIVLLSLSMIAGFTGLGLSIWNLCREDEPITFNYGDTDGNSVAFTEGSIAEIAAKVTPGVVSIVTEVRTTSFFGESSTSNAAGTGMIITSDGYVLTNKHVIEDAKKINVILDDGTTYEDIELVGTDPINDVAFLKIKDGKDLPTVSLGDSKTIHTGQQVIAIGNALGQFQNTITAGVISGIGRSITATSSDYSSSETLSDLIQTDAAINAGNSGGPLVNAAGQVIGINTATSQDADGIGFAIPISSVKGMLKNITTNNSADRAYVGTYYIMITPDVAKAYNLPVTSGAYLYSSNQYSAIAKNSPADKAGLKDKDIILEINGVKVGNAGSIASIIGEYAPGDTVQLKILREGKEKTLNITLDGYKAQNK